MNVYILTNNHNYPHPHTFADGITDIHHVQHETAGLLHPVQGIGYIAGRGLMLHIMYCRFLISRRIWHIISIE